MGDFAPSVEAAQKALGDKVPIESKAHPGGGAGVKFSLDEVAKRAAKGRNDPRIRAWAIRAVHAAGGPQGMVDQARAILKAQKKAAVYVQDPLNTEFIQAAHETLCLDDKGLCFRGGDCDDQTVAYAAATMSIGIPTNIVGQAFDNSGVPGHVIAAICDVKDKSKTWLRVDPSSDKPVGEFHAAKQEWWIDPLDPNDKTSSTVSGAGDYVGVGASPGARPGYTGLGASAAADVAATVTQQVQAALFSLTSAANNLAAALDQLDQIKGVIGYDPEPAYVINGLNDFPANGTWTPSMDKVSKDTLSQANFLIQCGEDALNGVRTIFVDPTTNDIGIGSVASDPYLWRIVLETATDAIIGIFSPAGALLVGITTQLGEVLTPAEVQTKVSSSSGSSGTIQGVGAAPIVVPLAITAAVVVATIAVYLAYTKHCATALGAAQEATLQSMVNFTQHMVDTGQWTAAQASDFLNRQRTLTNEAQQQNNADNPFSTGLDKLTSFLKWAALGAAVVGVGVLAFPVLEEASESAASAIHARRQAKKNG
jgi:hypothetical protein